jgi:hypothetical protein
MADQGWVKLYRKLRNDVIWQKCTLAQKVVMITILMSVNHSDQEWEWQGQKFTVHPGQMVTSLDSLRKLCGKGMTIQGVRGALLKLGKMGFSTDTSTKTGRLITVSNWAKYQDPDETQHSKQQTDNKATTPNKNVKNDKKKTPSSDALLDRFNALWKLYPKKLGKQNSFKAYKKAIKDGATDDQIKTGIEAYVKYLTKEQTDPQYIKQGSSFFNQRSWEDDWSGGGVTPEPQAPKTQTKAAAALREIRDEMALYPGVPLEEAAELAAKGLTENGRPTTAEKILKFLDKYGGEVNE